MKHTIYYCEICTSEILASRRLPGPHVCVLCQLSAEEALSCLEDQDDMSHVRYCTPSAGAPGQFAIPFA